VSDSTQPAIEIEGLQIWVHGYQFPDSTDALDGNWLRVTARCSVPGATVKVTGAILDTVSFRRFQRELTHLYETLDGGATLESHEPNLTVAVKAQRSTGHLKIRVNITPDHLYQKHDILLEADQTYLPAIIRGCNEVLRRYPVRDAGARGA
jgi:hypothetical protein